MYLPDLYFCFAAALPCASGYHRTGTPIAGTQARTDSLSDGYRHNVPSAWSDSLSGAQMACAAALYHDSPDTHPQGRVLIHSKQAYARTQPLQRTYSLSDGYRHNVPSAWSASLSGYRWHVLRLYTMTARTHTHRGAC